MTAVPMRRRMFGWCLIAISCGIAFAGCASPEAHERLDRQPNNAAIQSWPAPPDVPRIREDGEGPFPSSWPTAAVVCSSRDAVGPLDCTLFLLAGRRLSLDRPVEQIADYTRLAVPCSSSGLRGRWVELAKDQPPFFVLVHDSGGTGGLSVRVFQHSVGYPVEGEQTHSFVEIVAGESRIPPLIGDVDADQVNDLLIGTDATNSSGASSTPQWYRILKWKDGAVRETGEIASSDVQHVTPSLPRL